MYFAALTCPERLLTISGIGAHDRPESPLTTARNTQIVLLLGGVSSAGVAGEPKSTEFIRVQASVPVAYAALLGVIAEDESYDVQKRDAEALRHRTVCSPGARPSGDSGLAGGGHGREAVRARASRSRGMRSRSSTSMPRSPRRKARASDSWSNVSRVVDEGPRDCGPVTASCFGETGLSPERGMRLQHYAPDSECPLDDVNVRAPAPMSRTVPGLNKRLTNIGRKHQAQLPAEFNARTQHSHLVHDRVHCRE